MKFLKKFAYMLTLTGLVFGLGACSNDDVDYEPAAPVEGAQVYFSNEASTSISATVETTSFEVVVMRGNADEAITVPIKATITAKNVDDEAEPIDYASLFTIPQNVSFGAGKETTKISVGIDRENLEDGQTYNITLSLNDASVITPYGNSSITYTLVVPEPMVLLGTGYWTDGIEAAMFGIDTPTYPVEVYENLKNPGWIYLKDLYTFAYVDALINNWEMSEEDVEELKATWEEGTYVLINIEDPTQVYIPYQEVGNVIGNGPTQIGSVKDVYGTLENGIITFPADGLAWGDEYNGGPYPSNPDGLTTLYMPGTPMTDFSLELAYGGFRVAEDNETVYPIARAAYGEDVAEIQYAFVAGDITKDVDALEAALNGIEDGSVVSNKVAVTIAGEDEETGEPILEMTLESVEGAEPGVFTVIAIPYSAEGEAQYGDLAFTSFYVQGVGATEAPEVDLELEWMPFSVGMPDYASSYPDHSTWYCEMYGSEIKAMKYYLNTTAAIDGVLAQGATLEDIIAAYGKEYDPSYINADGWDYIFFTEMPAETSFTLIVWAENTYGNTVTLTASGATAAAPSAKKGNAKLSWDHINGRQIAFNPNKGISFSTIK